MLFLGCRGAHAQDARCRRNSLILKRDPKTKNYTFFMIPKPLLARLSNNMQSTDTNWQTCPHPQHLPALAAPYKESTLKLRLETPNPANLINVHHQPPILSPPLAP